MLTPERERSPQPVGREQAGAMLRHEQATFRPRGELDAAAAGRAPESGTPASPQNFASARFSTPQLEQVATTRK